MIKETLRKYISRKQISSVKLGTEYLKYKKLIESINIDNGLTAVLIGTPVHTNMGDHLIAVAEKTFLMNNGKYNNIIEIPTDVYMAFDDIVIKKISEYVPIFISGGGWMGNLWPVEETCLQKIVSDFHNNQILIFPQTIYFDKKFPQYYSLMHSGDIIYNSCKKLTMSLRDKQSYDYAKKHYINANVIFAPDIGLYYKWKRPQNLIRNNSIAFCLRHDREIIDNQGIIGTIEEYFLNNHYQIDEISTIAKSKVSPFNRDKEVEKTLEKFASYKCIVTNRLHGMIYSVLSNTPCIVLDNLTGKVFGVYSAWLRSDPQILFLKSDAELNNLNDKINSLNVGEFDVKGLESKFIVLKENINGRN